MPTITSASNEIDRKLHRIILDSSPEELANMMALARAIRKKKYTEFSYSRGGKMQFSSADTIQNYVSYAQKIGLLDGNLAPSRPKSDVRALENFQRWLSDTVDRYLTANNSAVNQIADVIQTLLQSVPCELPTPSKVHSRLQDPPTLKIFQLSLKIISLLRPNALRVGSRRLIIKPGLMQD